MNAAANTAPKQKLTEHYVLVNAYDEMVRTNVTSLMEQMDMCQCEKCFLDACALVFNRQYTHFVTTRQGELFTKVPDMNHGNHAEMTVVIVEALQMVQAHPNH